MQNGLCIDKKALEAADISDAEEYVFQIMRGGILIHDGCACMEEKMIIELFVSLPTLRQVQLFQVLEALENYYEA